MEKKENRPARVLQVLGGTGLGGAESRVMDSYRHLDRSRLQFDFCVHSGKEGYFDREIKNLGGHIYQIPRFKVYNWLSYRKAWKNFFKEHPGYLAVHGHMTSTASIYLPIAKKAGVPLTIAHARSAGVDPGIKGKITRFLRKNLGKKADLCLTCSAMAGEAVFGKKMQDGGKVITVPNAIDAAAFAYDEKTRREVREKYGLQDKFVVGHVGRFGFMKNHDFLLDVFAEIEKELPESRLLLIGEGEKMEEIRQKAAGLGLSEKVIFTGNQAKIWQFYQAMDYFVFPSVFEGLPGSVIEAQAAGLRCLVSDGVTPECVITPLAAQMSLEEGAKKWAARVLEERHYPRQVQTEAIKKAGFDIEEQVRMLDTIYFGKQERI